MTLSTVRPARRLRDRSSAPPAASAAVPTNLETFEACPSIPPCTACPVIAPHVRRGQPCCRSYLACNRVLVTLMSRRFNIGDCVRMPDGGVGRVGAVEAGRYRVRVRRRTSETHQFLLFPGGGHSRVQCPAPDRIRLSEVDRRGGLLASRVRYPHCVGGRVQPCHLQNARRWAARY